MTDDSPEQPKNNDPRAKARVFASVLAVEMAAIHRLLYAALILENDQNVRRMIAPSDNVIAVILPARSGWMFAGPDGITFTRRPPHKGIAVQLSLDAVTSAIESGTWAVQASRWERYAKRASTLLRATLGVDQQANQ